MNLRLHAFRRVADRPPVDRHSPPCAEDPGLVKEGALERQEMRVRKRAITPPPQRMQRCMDEIPTTDLRHVGLEEPWNAGIEAHDRKWPVITTEVSLQCRHPAPEIVLDFHFEENGNPSRDER